jgi:NTP pyrophosphatase (non-canonical NTP hydrolase)
MANAENIDLTQAYERKMDKVLKRDNNRFERKK